jgi:prepilin-type N-terminal cleavage/methylation domain-containing protein/prepilin-type processing-associated H-X9-DG protein
MNHASPPPCAVGARTAARAFTLLELLVVIVIVAILAALLLPGFRSAKLQSYSVRSSQNLRQLVAANIAYAADQGFYAPADDKWNKRRWHGARTSVSAPFDPITGFLADYLGKSREVIRCPLFTEMLAGQKSFEDGTGGYGYNSAYIGGRPGGDWNADGTRLSARPAQVLRPSVTLMFATTAFARADGVQEYASVEPPFWDYGSGPSDDRPSPSLHFRFQGKAIVGWCDGHISMETPGPRTTGTNPYGGDAGAHNLGWFGPDEANGYWNPSREP